MTAPQQFLTASRERFLKALLAELPVESIRELYLFQPIRQGGVESGVAVVAAYPDGSSAVGRRPSAVTTESPETNDDAVPESFELSDMTGENVEGGSCEVAAAPDSRRPPPDEKYTVFTARYRHTIKGADRGKWESSVVAEADAPLLSIETVVRGVQRRSGDVDPPDHMSAGELRAALRIESDTGAA